MNYRKQVPYESHTVVGTYTSGQDLVANLGHIGCTLHGAARPLHGGVVHSGCQVHQSAKPHVYVVKTGEAGQHRPT